MTKRSFFLMPLFALLMVGCGSPEVQAPQPVAKKADDPMSKAISANPQIPDAAKKTILGGK